MMYLSEQCVSVQVTRPMPSRCIRPSILPSQSLNTRPALRMAIEYARIRMQMSVDDLSDATAIDAATLHDYEVGNAFPTAQHIAILEEQLGVVLVPR